MANKFIYQSFGKHELNWPLAAMTLYTSPNPIELRKPTHHGQQHLKLMYRLNSHGIKNMLVNTVHSILEFLNWRFTPPLLIWLTLLGYQILHPNLTCVTYICNLLCSARLACNSFLCTWSAVFSSSRFTMLQVSHFVNRFSCNKWIWFCSQQNTAVLYTEILLNGGKKGEGWRRAYHHVGHMTQGECPPPPPPLTL